MANDLFSDAARIAAGTKRIYGYGAMEACDLSGGVAPPNQADLRRVLDPHQKEQGLQTTSAPVAAAQVQSQA